MKPWKRILSTETELELLRLQWGHGDEAVEEAACTVRGRRMAPCFNGATAMKPWKSWATPGRSCSPSTGFNGATAMKPWKRFLRTSVTRPVERLQWGHGDEAVEERRGRDQCDRLVLASMGPRR